MKKHLVTLFVFIYIAAFFFSALTGVVTRAEELPETNSTEDTTLPQTEPSAEEGISALLDMEAKEPEWMSYSDFVLAQNERALKDPSIFVGCLAQLNPAWQTLMFAANPAAKTAARANGSASNMVDENGDAYLRVGDSSRKLNAEMLAALEYSKGIKSYESRIVDDATIDDLDDALIQEYTQLLGTTASSSLDLLKGRGLIKL